MTPSQSSSPTINLVLNNQASATQGLDESKTEDQEVRQKPVNTIAGSAPSRTQGTTSDHLEITPLERRNVEWVPCDSPEVVTWLRQMPPGSMISMEVSIPQGFPESGVYDHKKMIFKTSESGEIDVFQETKVVNNRVFLLTDKEKTAQLTDKYYPVENSSIILNTGTPCTLTSMDDRLDFEEDTFSGAEQVEVELTTCIGQQKIISKYGIDRDYEYATAMSVIVSAKQSDKPVTFSTQHCLDFENIDLDTLISENDNLFALAMTSDGKIQKLPARTMGPGRLQTTLEIGPDPVAITFARRKNMGASILLEPLAHSGATSPQDTLCRKRKRREEERREEERTCNIL